MAAARKIVMIRLADIVIGDNRLRPLDKARVEGLKATIADPACPPLLPIEVCQKPGQKNWTLLDGLHRTTAFREAGREEIEALVHDNDTITARTVELQRNLFNTDLSAWEKARHVAELYYLERAKRGVSPDEDPRRLGGRPAKAVKEAEQETSAIVAEVSLSGAVGQSIGLKERQIRNYLTLFRAIAPVAAEKLERFGFELPFAQLMTLAKQTPVEQVAIVDRLLIPTDHPDEAVLAQRVKTVSAAIAKPAQKKDDSKALSAFIGSFSRMSLAEKKGALALLKGQLPAGFVLMTPDDEEDLDIIGEALGAAFTLTTNLLPGGDPVEDDDIKDVANQTQLARMRLGRVKGARA